MRALLYPAAVFALVGAAWAQTPRDAAAPGPRLTGTATITGVVLSSDSANAPVRLARVTLNSVDRGGAAETATTDAAGRFVFRALPAGRYAIQASKRAWLDASFGATRLGRPGTPVAVRDGEHVAGLTIRMTRGAVITGVVRDTAGEPQPEVQVRVLQYVTRNGLRTLERPLSTNPNDPLTDDDGVYRAYGLPPGEYVVVAAVRLGSDSRGLGGDEIRPLAPGDVDRALTSAAGAAGAVAPLSAHAGDRGPLTYAPVYLPGTTDLAAATTISLGPGEERSGADIRFALFPAARVTGRVPSIPTGSALPGEPDRPPECRITPAGFEDLMAEPIAAAVTRIATDLRLQFAGVPPGRYTIVCVAGRPSGPTGAQLLGFAEAAVVVDGRDQDISLAFGPAGTLSGRVVYEGDTPPADAGSEVGLAATPFGKARLLRRFSLRPAPDGTFHFGAIVPGGWAIAANAAPGSRWTVKSLSLGGRELHDSLITVTEIRDLGELVITLTDRPSDLSGALQDVAGRPATEYFVIAFSTDREAWTPTSRRIQSTRPASDGAFSIKGLPAGEYFLAALTDVEPGEWLSPAFLDQVVAASVRVRITDGERTVQGLRIAR